MEKKALQKSSERGKLTVRWVGDLPDLQAKPPPAPGGAGD